MGQSVPARPYDTVDDVLAHYGVKGMKWGVRKGDDSGGGSSKSEKPGPSEDVQKVDSHKSVIKSGGTRALSNKELKEVVDRMNLEQQYSTLQSKNGGTLGSKIDKGHDFIKKGAGFGETGVKIYNMINSPAGAALRKLMLGV